MKCEEGYVRLVAGGKWERTQWHCVAGPETVVRGRVSPSSSKPRWMLRGRAGGVGRDEGRGGGADGKKGEWDGRHRLVECMESVYRRVRGGGSST